MKNKNGFTFIELLISLMLISICFIPLMRMFSNSTEQALVLDELTTATYLAKGAMEKLKNLNLQPAEIEKIGDVYNPPLTQSPLLMNGRYWRTLRKIIKDTAPLEVHIIVYRQYNDPGSNFISDDTPTLELVTLIEDLTDWKIEEKE